MLNKYEEDNAYLGENSDVLEKIIKSPSLENEYFQAKSFLQKRSPFSGDNLYDHLTDVLNKILAERPENVIDFFEEYSRKVKEKRFRIGDNFEDIFVSPTRYEQVNKTMPLVKTIPKIEPSTLDPDDLNLADMSNNNLLLLLYYFEISGLGIPKNEMFAINLSMRKLIHEKPIAKINFWGKIYGLQQNYIILETELKEEEYVKMNNELETEANQKEENKEDANRDDFEKALKEIENNQQLAGEGGAPKKLWTELPPLPKSDYTPPPEAPNELAGVGVNRKVYFVCTQVGDPWVQLPNVTPKQIRVARQIYHSFTGNLEHNIKCYPEFPGVEKNYLRAQIARITASTHVSPLGFYTFGENAGEADEAPEESKTEYKENLKYDPPSLKDLTDASMLFWVHHEHYILPQGRITWWNPNPFPEIAGEGMEGEGEEEKADEGKKISRVEPETGPNILTPCSEDVTIEGISSWSVKKSSTIFEAYALAVVRSNLWPGAYCFSTQGKLFKNVYFGNGLKYMVNNFSPTPLPFVQQDYPIGPEILEITDPTGAEEEAWRLAHLPKVPPIPQIGEGQAGEGGEEEDEDEDEDD